MTELREMRVPGLGLAPMKPTDDLYPRDYDPLVEDFLRSKQRQAWPAALFERLRTAARRSAPADRRARRAPRMNPGPGMTFGRMAR